MKTKSSKGIDMRIEIKGKANSEKYEYGFAEVRTYSPREIMTKSLKSLAIFWGIAIVSILLPIVHFVSVPAFFLIGIFTALRARKYHEEFISGEITCPHCSKQITIGKTPIIWPVPVICQSCASVVSVTPKSDS